MNQQKGFWTKLGQLIDDHYTEKAQQLTSAQHGHQSRKRLQRLLGWLTPNGGTLLLVIMLIATAPVWARPLTGPVNMPGPSATTVSYQGRLADNAGTPLDGSYGMTFALYDAATSGNPVWTEDHPAVPVSDGLFVVGLGSRTAGGIPTTTWNGDRYLEITVGGETLSPRELIRSVPIAGMALTVPDGAIGTNQLADASVTGAKISPGSISDEHFAPNLIMRLPSAHQVVRAQQSAIPAWPNNIEVGDSTITLNESGKVFATCSVTIRPDANPKESVALRVVAQRETTIVGISDYVYQGTLANAYTNISTSGILSLPAGTWTIQCQLHRSSGDGDPIVHTYSITALQIE